MANILAVDDSVSIRHLVVETLTAAKHRVAAAENGNAGLAAAVKERFDLVITDVNMPGMDGLTLVQKLRDLPAYRTVPILILSTEMDPEKKKIAKNSGATGWLVKPFDPGQLLTTVRKVID
jgi:two-component system, chemotaxis family, chemotaxis protein CheY